jgi:hypothetical protein
MGLPRWVYGLICAGLITISAVLFVLSLATDCFYISGENPRAWSSGFGLLCLGWLGIFGGIVAWFANPLLLLTWVCMAIRPLRWVALGALILALSFLLHSSILKAPPVPAVRGFSYASATPLPPLASFAWRNPVLPRAQRG